MNRVPIRWISCSGRFSARGKRLSELPNPILPSKLVKSGLPARIQQYELRKEFESLERQVEHTKLELSRLESIQIKSLLDDEIRRTDQENDYNDEDFVYFYFWNIEDIFFGLLVNNNENMDMLSSNKYQNYHFPVESQAGTDNLIGRFSRGRNEWRYRKRMMLAENNQDNFQLPHFENTFIPIECVSINVSSGTIFVHFYKSKIFSLILQLSVESSNLCDVSISEECNGNVPTFIRTVHNTFLIKVPFSNQHYLKLFFQLDRNALEEDDRLIWKMNPVTSRIIDRA